MKNNGLTTILNWALIVGAVALCISGIKYYNQSKTSRTYRGLLGEFSQFQSAQGLVNGLVNETLEYSKSHPEMNPTLEALGLKQGAKPTSSPVKPAAAK